MQALQAVMLAGRAGILRSARLPQPTAAVVVVQALALLLQARGVVEAASVRRVPLRPRRVHMVQEAEATAVRLLASALWVVAAVALVLRRQVVRVVLACTHVMAVLGLVLVEVFPLQTLLMLVVQAARASGRPLAQLTAQAVHRALLVPHPLPVGCSGRVEAAAVHLWAVG